MNGRKNVDREFYLGLETENLDLSEEGSSIFCTGLSLEKQGEILEVLQEKARCSEEWGNSFTAFLIEEFGLSDDSLSEIEIFYGDLEMLSPETKEEIVMNLQRDNLKDFSEKQELVQENTQWENIVDDQGPEAYMPTAYHIEDFE